jgi:hypothetical protein
MEEIKFNQLVFKDIEELEKVAGEMLGGDHFNPATGEAYNVFIKGDTIFVSVDRAFRDSIIKTLSYVEHQVNKDKRFTNIRPKGNSILADLVTPVEKITKVEFTAFKDRG